MINKVRRIVTGCNEKGESTILIDEDAANQKDLMPGLRATDIWATETSPADNTGFNDMGIREFRVSPPPSGTVFRYLEFDPGIGVNNPGWHATDTVDYIIIVKGEIWCLMDDREVFLKAGDLLVQRGTNHSWANRSNEKCIMIAVMLSATPLP